MILNWPLRGTNGNAESWGLNFLDCVEIAVKLVLENPTTYKILYSDFRGCVIRRFPFSIFYTIEDKEIVVHSVFDNRQDPEKRP